MILNFWKPVGNVEDGIEGASRERLKDGGVRVSLECVCLGLVYGRGLLHCVRMLRLWSVRTRFECAFMSNI